MRPIDADELEAELLNMVDLHSEIENPMAIILLQVVIDIVKKMDTVKAESVKHGEWIRYNGENICSECHCCNFTMTFYCPHCGARMDGGDENDE